jgi:hypothetical protein
MKYLAFVFWILLFSCSEKPKEDDTQWKEMDEFHTVMADVYHPLVDSKDLAPIKKDHAKLAAAADKWAQAPLPEKVNNEKVKKMLSELAAGAAELHTKIEAGLDDEQIAADLTKLHDLFHSIMESWYKEDKHIGT